MRIDKLRATSHEWRSTYPWHFGGSIPANSGPVVGVDLLSGRAPFGIDPFEWVRQGIVANPNIVVSGAPANGKSGLAKEMIWWLAGHLGIRFVATDVKGEYTPLARALEVPVLDMSPSGLERVNPLDHPDGRVEFVHALGALCVDRSLTPVEAATLAAAERALPDHPVVSDLVAILREMPDRILNELVMDRRSALDETRGLRFGIQSLMSGVHAGMFDSATNVDLSNSPRGFVVDVSRCGTDDQALRFALLVGQRAADQLINSTRGQTLVVSDEAWRLAGNKDTVRWMQHSFKLGRNVGQANMVVVHRLWELGHQADGAVGAIASKLVADADIHVVFRQGDFDDAQDTVKRLNLPASAVKLLIELPAHRCLIKARGRLALVDVKLSSRMRDIAWTNDAMEAVA
jgi:type IV secretory pathway VirB4 component